MARYIDADKLIAYLHREDFHTPDERWKPESEFANIIEATPTADVEEVRHGHWEYNRHQAPNEKLYFCSLCAYGESDYGMDKYCPHCGAKMDGGKDVKV